MMDDAQVDPAVAYTMRARLAEGKSLAQEGDREQAAEIFRDIIHSDPNNEDAWLWLAYVAESRQDSLTYMREARALMPHSERIAEGLQWAEQRLGRLSDVRPEAEPPEKPKLHIRRPGRSVRPPVPGRVKDVAAQLDDAASAAAEAAAGVASETTTRALQGIRDGAQRARRWLPSLTTEGWRSVISSLILIVAVAGIVGFVYLGIVNARNSGVSGDEIELPTRVPDPTATLTVDQRTSPLWAQADVSWTRQDWQKVIEALDRVREADPYDDEARVRLAEAHFCLGTQLIDENELDRASQELDTAIRLNAGTEGLQQVRRDLKLYLEGLDAYWQQDWPRAVQRLSKLHDRTPGFRDTTTMLGQAYYRVGIERQESEVWDEARDAYESAMGLLPDLEDAGVRYQQVMDIIIPPKRVEVDLSAKVGTMYYDNQIVDTFPVCTGRASAPTLPGRYEIQSKMPTAYASKWDLDMPWWLGIYWAGGSENGFHGLPTRSGGQVLWSNSLGTGCSFGCIVLETNQAKQLYDWVEIGDVVIVTP